MSASHKDKCWAVVPAAGIGSRMLADLPKQYLEVAGATILEHSIRALLNCDFIEKIVLPLNPQDSRAASLPLLDNPKIIRAEGGEQRSDSVLSGLQALDSLAEESDWVLVHDAVRPCVLPGDISRLALQLISSGIGGVLAQPIVDTVKRSNDAGMVTQTLEREQLWAAQTPQMFRLGLLRKALLRAVQNKQPITDEASAMELAGEEVQLVQGSATNIKITVPSDLPLAEFYLAKQNDNSNL